MTREYEAIVIGTMTAGGMIDKPIGRHSTKRTLMSVSPMGKHAVTHYRVAEHFREHTRLRLRLKRSYPPNSCAHGLFATPTLG